MRAKTFGKVLLTFLMGPVAALFAQTRTAPQQIVPTAKQVTRPDRFTERLSGKQI